MSSKLREMVESLLELLDDFGINEEIVSISNENIVHRESLKTERTLAVLRKAKSALAEPIRNCDVGTAEEQTRRMKEEYCTVQKSCYESPSGRQCPLYKAGEDCRLIWAQMPYETVKTNNN